MKKIIAIIMTAMFLVVFSTSAGIAGPKKRHHRDRDRGRYKANHYRWEGVAIGVGAAVLGHALINAHRHRNNDTKVIIIDREPPHRPPPPPQVPSQAQHSYYPPPSGRHGHWEIRKIWVPPAFERVWNPSHYNERNEWIAGQWIEIEREPGYWREEKVWVSGK